MVILRDLPAYEIERDGYRLSTDRTKLDLDLVHSYLAGDSYWARGLDRALFERALEGSVRSPSTPLTAASPPSHGW
ncbi:hypothetical protein [Sinorhizobium fredii]|uniref:hypothetical protein n=1 Tax=Rhizobium fredii TaxID=380 RepID=UPI000B045FA0|nr:hypothetical protein [Sinorhizobium fredii]